ncbi:glycosyltransferase family 2 protein [Clostridium hydrogenum]|uniref:glycosyltransferase family 2 protein n=1 Tax=Clostridium hydrogenum TaxID=2855764 RepID=UPI001F3EE334|nr:glycosyltransferase family 2 protein [Clostridium hydrogenum]
MEGLRDLMIVFLHILTETVFVFSLYYLGISFFGLYKKKSLHSFKPQKRFALVVAAHNEEVVINDILSSLNSLDYPKNLYDIFVIADNCTDHTAQKSMETGALVYKRVDNKKKGKGYALEWMFHKISQMNKKYDAVCIFDADNLVSKNFLNEMNKKLCEGCKVIQGYLDSKNPRDTWITGSYSITFWANNRMAQLSRNNLGISSQLGGTGCCIDIDILKKLGWEATCLTEDLEFTCKLIANGYKVDFAYDAIVYDEKPLTLAQSWRQRKRWMQGFADVCSRYFFKLLKRGVKERSFTAIDCALYTIQPILFILFGIATLVGAANFCLGSYDYVSNFNYNAYSADTNVYNIITFVVAALIYLYVPVLLIFENKFDFKILIYYIIMPLYVITWLPICIEAIFSSDNKEWSHTLHTRSVNINDLEKNR